MVNVAIDSHGSTDFVIALHAAYGDRHVVDHAEALTMVGEGVMKSAADVEGEQDDRSSMILAEALPALNESHLNRLGLLTSRDGAQVEHIKHNREIYDQHAGPNDCDPPK